jgi:hypothetical protein
LNIAGLNIEDQLAAATFIQSRFGLRFKHIGDESVKLPANTADRTSALHDALELWHNSHGIRGVVVGLPLSSFSHLLINLPVTSTADMAGALAFELEKHLPLSPEEYQYDFHHVGPSPDGEGSRVLVLAIRKDKIRWIEQAITDTGIKIIAVRCSDIELMNEFMKTESARDVVFASKSNDTFHVTGIGEKGPEIIKSFSMGTGVRHEISQLSVTYSMGVFTSGIVDTEVLKDLDVRELTFSLPLLLALSAIKRRPVSLNFLSRSLRPRQRDYYTYAIASLAGTAVTLFFITSLLAYYKDYAALSRITKRIDEIKSTSSQLVETRRETELLNAKLEFLDAFQRERNRHIAILNEVSVTLPKDAWLTNYLSDEKDMVELEGYARRSASIIAPFENSNMFREVEFTSPVIVRQGKERFSIKMKVVK